jgi:hypothetical protein
MSVKLLPYRSDVHRHAGLTSKQAETALAGRAPPP